MEVSPSCPKLLHVKPHQIVEVVGSRRRVGLGQDSTNVSGKSKGYMRILYCDSSQGHTQFLIQNSMSILGMALQWSILMVASIRAMVLISGVHHMYLHTIPPKET